MKFHPSLVSIRKLVDANLVDDDQYGIVLTNNSGGVSDGPLRQNVIRSAKIGLIASPIACI